MKINEIQTYPANLMVVLDNEKKVRIDFAGQISAYTRSQWKSMLSNDSELSNLPDKEIESILEHLQFAGGRRFFKYNI